MNNYTFNEARHLHMLDGEALTGVTTILSVIAKPALIQWFANEAVKYLIEHGKLNSGANRGLVDEYTVTLDQLEAAKTAHRIKKEKAADLGTETHALIETLIKDAISKTSGVIGLTEHENKQVKHFLDWSKENKVKFLESEVHIYSKELWVGGICDIVCEIDGQVWIGDIKTSSNIYPEHFFQCAGYDICLKEMKMYENVAGYVILNLTKTGQFKEKRSASNGDNIKAFRAALDLYRIQEKIKNIII